ncbi:sphingomyelin phosphodiesterase [Streptomyces sp. NPDC057675]|uniref:sphingomyelin phosphodiesterase n=1 Tax=Streptomyces sp. NPDC057675 TaxID=3346204 RepID=UPI0036C1D9B4
MIGKRTAGIGMGVALAIAAVATGPSHAKDLAAEPAATTAAAFPSVMTHNLMLLPSGVTDWDPDERARMAGNSDHLRSEDILVLTELFDDSATDDNLFPRLRVHHPYQTPVIGRGDEGWDRTTGSYQGFPNEDGGVAIVSKYPIVYRSQHIFEDGCGDDFWASKGFAYAVVNAAGKRVHVVGTHLQADDPGCDPGEAKSVRAKQLDEISTYLTALRIPASEPVMIAGDLNVNALSSEYSSTLSRLNVAPPTLPSGTKSSFDPRTNSIARYREPNATPAHLDYVFLRNDHAKPAGGWTNSTKTVHSPSYTMNGHTFTDFSDHYPVVGRPTVAP